LARATRCRRRINARAPKPAATRSAMSAAANATKTRLWLFENVDAMLAIKSVKSRHNVWQAKEIFLRQLQCPFVRMVMNTKERPARLIELNVSAKHVTHGTIREKLCNTPGARKRRALTGKCFR
jgi:hypothetical protein